MKHKVIEFSILRAQSGTGKTATYSISALQSVDVKVRNLIKWFLELLAYFEMIRQPVSFPFSGAYIRPGCSRSSLAIGPLKCAVSLCFFCLHLFSHTRTLPSLSIILCLHLISLWSSSPSFFSFKLSLFSDQVSFPLLPSLIHS